MKNLIISFLCFICISGCTVRIDGNSNPITKLSIEERRAVAIQFMAEYPSWRYTLCNMPMDGKGEQK